MLNEWLTAPVTSDFKDPIDNYEPKTYDNSVEPALAEETVEAIQHQP